MTTEQKSKRVQRLVSLIKAATMELGELTQSQVPTPPKSTKVSFKREVAEDYAMSVTKRRLKAKI